MGLVRFARYAYAPNQLGYCGPTDHRRVLVQGALGASTVHLDDLAHLVRRFDGPWPYLRVLAAAAGIADPLDERVVEAYWIGNELLDLVAPADLRAAVVAHLDGAPALSWPDGLSPARPWAVANHGLHVFGVYPWLDLLARTGGGHPLVVLDRCRIRWGRVVHADASHAVVQTPALDWDRRRLGLGPERTEQVVVAVDGAGFVDDLSPGEHVALHWDWVCERLDDTQVRRLRALTDDQLAAANDRLDRGLAPAATAGPPGP